MPSQSRTLSLCLLAAATLSSLISCQQLNPPKKVEETEKPKAKVRDQLVGVITSVNKDFVLIQKYGAWNVPEGDIVFSRGENGQTANLAFSGETLGQFIAADIRSGTATLKDGVYWRQVLDQEATTISPNTAPGKPNPTIN